MYSTFIILKKKTSKQYKLYLFCQIFSFCTYINYYYYFMVKYFTLIFASTSSCSPGTGTDKTSPDVGTFIYTTLR